MSVYYVTKAGSDTNDGLSPSTSFLTLGKVTTTMGTGGHTVYVSSGVYAEQVMPNVGGKWIDYIGDVTGTYTGQAAGTVTVSSPSLPIIDGNSFYSATDIIFNFSGTSGANITKLICGTYAMGSYGPNRNCTFTRCDFTVTSSTPNPSFSGSNENTNLIFNYCTIVYPTGNTTSRNLIVLNTYYPNNITFNNCTIPNARYMRWYARGVQPINFTASSLLRLNFNDCDITMWDGNYGGAFDIYDTFIVGITAVNTIFRLTGNASAYYGQNNFYLIDFLQPHSFTNCTFYTTSGTLYDKTKMPNTGSYMLSYPTLATYAISSSAYVNSSVAQYYKIISLQNNRINFKNYNGVSGADFSMLLNGAIIEYPTETYNDKKFIRYSYPALVNATRGVIWKMQLTGGVSYNIATSLRVNNSSQITSSLLRLKLYKFTDDLSYPIVNHNPTLTSNVWLTDDITITPATTDTYCLVFECRFNNVANYMDICKPIITVV